MRQTKKSRKAKGVFNDLINALPVELFGANKIFAIKNRLGWGTDAYIHGAMHHKLGKGWEEELAAAIARDKEREQDRLMAETLRTAAAADAKKRGGKVARKKRATRHHPY